MKDPTLEVFSLDSLEIPELDALNDMDAYQDIDSFHTTQLILTGTHEHLIHFIKWFYRDQAYQCLIHFINRVGQVFRDQA